MHRVGILVALKAEGRTLHGGPLHRDRLHSLPGGHLLALSGTGPERARTLGEALIQQGVRGLVSWGCAAALAPDIGQGQLMVPGQVLDEHGTPHPVHSDWRETLTQTLETLQPIGGTLLASARVIAHPEEKQRLHQTTGALALDMESGALARLAAEAQLPFLVIRSISDEARMALPRPVLGALTDGGEVRPLALFGGIVREPRSLPDLIRLGQGFNSAMKALKLTRARLGPDLGLHRALEGSP